MITDCGWHVCDKITQKTYSIPETVSPGQLLMPPNSMMLVYPTFSRICTHSLVGPQAALPAVRSCKEAILQAKSRENRRACRRFSIYSLPTASYKDLFDILGRSGRPERLFFYLVYVNPDFRISGIDIFRFLCYTVIEIFRISGFPKGVTPWNATSPKRSTP